MQLNNDFLLAIIIPSYFSYFYTIFTKLLIDVCHYCQGLPLSNSKSTKKFKPKDNSLMCEG
jgi:phosphoglycerol transferase MdoB-like AlkP superfamily enzyme